jgi:hypothetical protein
MIEKVLGRLGFLLDPTGSGDRTDACLLPENSQPQA